MTKRLNNYKSHVRYWAEADFQLIEMMIIARKEARVRQTDLAVRLEQPQSYVSKIENRERRIDVAEYVAWMQALGINPTTHLAALTADPVPFLLLGFPD